LIAAAVKIVRIATRQEEEEYDTPEGSGKSPASVSMGKRGGKARAKKMTPERRAEIAIKTAEKRWQK
jgi:hypothetical protein